MTSNENTDASNSSCPATSSRSGRGIFLQNSSSFSTMQPNSSQAQEQYETSPHQHNLAGNK